MTNVFCFRRPEPPGLSQSLTLTLRRGKERGQAVCSDRRVDISGLEARRTLARVQQRQSGAARSWHLSRPRRSPISPSLASITRDVSGSQSSHLPSFLQGIEQRGSSVQMVAELSRGVWEPRTDCALSLSPSLEKPIDLNSKKGICFKEVERQVGAVAGEISSH